MKRAATILLALFFIGCQQSSADQGHYGPRIYRDSGTGCEYVANNSNSSALTPRMGADGKQICRHGGMP